VKLSLKTKRVTSGLLRTKNQTTSKQTFSPASGLYICRMRAARQAKDKIILVPVAAEHCRNKEQTWEPRIQKIYWKDNIYLRGGTTWRLQRQSPNEYDENSYWTVGGHLVSQALGQAIPKPVFWRHSMKTTYQFSSERYLILLGYKSYLIFFRPKWISAYFSTSLTMRAAKKWKLFTVYGQPSQELNVV
jgi:hypothetical protein